jgi:hypothetical protein
MKFRAMAGPGTDRTERMVDALRNATLESDVPPLWELA